MGPYIDHHLAGCVDRGEVTETEAAYLVDFLSEWQAEHGTADRTIKAMYDRLITWRKFLSLSTESIADVHRGRARMEGRGYKQNSKRGMLEVLKRFLRWRCENGSAMPLEKIDRIQVPSVDRHTKNPDQMVTKAEYEQLIEAARHPRDRAVVAMLYEGGFRPVELVRLTWGAIRFDRYGCLVTTSEKTGTPRTVRLIAAAGYLAQWREQYPIHPIEADTPVFIQYRKRPFTALTYRGFVGIMGRLVATAGTRDITLYLFRHTSVTNMLNDEIPESVIKLQHWGSLSTGMLSTYGHLTTKHQDDILLARAGIKQRDKRASQRVNPCQCPKCFRVSPPTFEFCPNCGMPLTEGAQLRQDIAVTRLWSDETAMSDAARRLAEQESASNSLKT